MIKGLNIFYTNNNKGSGLNIIVNKGDGLKLINGKGCNMTKNNTNNSKKKSQKGSCLKILK